MKKHIILLLLPALMLQAAYAQNSTKKTSGNPIAQGWYADPEATIFGKEYWVYPTYSDNIRSAGAF
jgi:hypothetical protein